MARFVVLLAFIFGYVAAQEPLVVKQLTPGDRDIMIRLILSQQTPEPSTAKPQSFAGARAPSANAPNVPGAAGGYQAPLNQMGSFPLIMMPIRWSQFQQMMPPQQAAPSVPGPQAPQSPPDAPAKSPAPVKQPPPPPPTGMPSATTVAALAPSEGNAAESGETTTQSLTSTQKPPSGQRIVQQFNFLPYQAPGGMPADQLGAPSPASSVSSQVGSAKQLAASQSKPSSQALPQPNIRVFAIPFYPGQGQVPPAVAASSSAASTNQQLSGAPAAQPAAPQKPLIYYGAGQPDYLAMGEWARWMPPADF